MSPNRLTLKTAGSIRFAPSRCTRFASSANVELTLLLELGCHNNFLDAVTVGMLTASLSVLIVRPNDREHTQTMLIAATWLHLATTILFG